MVFAGISMRYNVFFFSLLPIIKEKLSVHKSDTCLLGKYTNTFRYKKECNLRCMKRRKNLDVQKED